MSSSTSRPAVPINQALLARYKPAKIFKGAVDQAPPNAPGRFGSRDRDYGPRHITGLSFDDGGDTVVTAGEDDTFRLYNCRTGKHMKTLNSKRFGVNMPRFTHKSTTILHTSTKEDHTIRYHSLHDNKYLQYFKGHQDAIISLDMHPLDDTFMSGSIDNTVRLWDLRSQNCRGKLTLPAPPIAAYDSQGMIFAVALNTFQKLILYDVKQFDKEPFLTVDIKDPYLDKLSYPPRKPFMTSMSFSSNGKWILIGTAGDAHYVIDAFDGFVLARLEGFRGLEGGKNNGPPSTPPVRGISGEEACWTPDSNFIISGSANGSIYMWDAANIPTKPAPDGENIKVLMPVVTLDGHPTASRCVKYNPRIQMMVTAGAELAFWLPDNTPEPEKAGDETAGKGKERMYIPMQM